MRDHPLTFHWRVDRTFLDRAGIRASGDRRYDQARASIFACAALNTLAGDAWTSYSRRKAFYVPVRRYHGLPYSYDNVLRAVEDGCGHGLLEEVRARPGDHVRTGLQSKVRATPRLVAALADAEVRRELPDSALIRLKDQAGNLRPFAETAQTVRLRREIAAINEGLRGTRVDAGPGVETMGHHWKIGDAYVQPGRIEVYRVFGRARFDRHGRLYGWWQNLPKIVRRDLLINGELAVEADFSALHPTLLYGMRGKRLDFDPYDTGVFTRDEAKVALNVALNANSLHGAVSALMRDEGWGRSWRYTSRLVDAVVARNKAIESDFGADRGVELMHLDSRIAIGVLTDCVAAGVPVLPVHDSYLVQARHEAFVTASMEKNLRSVCEGVSHCRIKTSRPTVPHMGPPAPAPAGAPPPPGPPSSPARNPSPGCATPSSGRPPLVGRPSVVRPPRLMGLTGSLPVPAPLACRPPLGAIQALRERLRASGMGESPVLDLTPDLPSDPPARRDYRIDCPPPRRRRPWERKARTRVPKDALRRLLTGRDGPASRA